MADYRNEAKDCDLNVLNDILDNIDNHGYIDDEDENAEEDLSKVDSKRPNNSHVKPSPLPSLAAESKPRFRGRGGNDRNDSSAADVRRRPSNDDSLRKLEEERKRLELENEEIKRQVEKLKQQELLMEQAAKQGYSGKSLMLRELTGREEGSENVLKRSPEADFEKSEANRGDRVKTEAEETTSDVDDNADGSHFSSKGSAKNSAATAADQKENSRVRRRISTPSPRGKRTKSDTRESRTSQSDNNNKRKRRDSSPINSRKKPPSSFNSRRSRHESPGREVSSKLKYVFKDAKYFLIKSSNHENVALAQAKGVWSSPPPNEMRINQAFKTHSNVILLFSVKESGKFQGFARVAAESDRNHPPIRWVLPVGISARMLSGVFTLDWINRNELDFEKTLNIRNTYNEGSAVKIGRDGQEIDPVAGEDVCRLFPRDRRTDLNAIADKSKRSLKTRGISVDRHQSRRSPPKRRRSDDDSSSRHQNYPERERERERHGGMDSRGWNDRRSRSYERRIERSSPNDRYSSRDHHHMHNGPLNDFEDFHHHKMPHPIPPQFIPPPVYGHMHPPPPPPPFIFDRFSRAELPRHIMEKRSIRHDEDDFMYRSSRESRNRPYDRQARDRR